MYKEKDLLKGVAEEQKEKMSFLLKYILPSHLKNSNSK